ncbi:MAG: rod shape-determining protein MreD [Paraperlucidibaca sp.]
MPRHRNPLPGMLLSVIAALLLCVMPLPEELNPWRPEWLTLMLIFWGMHAPQWVGIWTALVLGVLLDVLLATPLGFYGLSAVIVMQLTQATQRWSGIFSVRQTTMLLLGLIAVSRGIHYVLLVLQNLTPDPALFFLPVLSSAMMWPTILLLLKRWSQRT